MKALLMIGAIIGFIAVALGAFGAHGLEGKISESSIKIWEKAVLYQMFHTISILGTGIMMLKFNSAALLSAGYLFFIGILLFSGSLYIYSTTGIKALAMITPIGGIVFLAGWIVLGYAMMKLL